VLAPPPDLALIEGLVTTLDRPAGPERKPEVRTVALRFARAEALAPIVTQLLNDASIGAARPPKVMADPRVNALVFTAVQTGPGASPSSSALDLAEQLVQQLDVDPAKVRSTAPRSVRVLTVTNADAGALAANIDAMFAQGDAVPAGEVAPAVRVDAASN